jgi:hypothetical protein
VSLSLAAALFPLTIDRLRVVGTFAQYHGSFGLLDYTATPLARGGAVMALFVLAGATFLLAKLRLAHK